LEEYVTMLMRAQVDERADSILLGEEANNKTGDNDVGNNGDGEFALTSGRSRQSSSSEASL
jgi:hypothetical protein